MQGQTWGAGVCGANATNSSASQQKTLAAGGGIINLHPVQPRTVGLEVNGSF